MNLRFVLEWCRRLYYLLTDDYVKLDRDRLIKFARDDDRSDQ